MSEKMVMQLEDLQLVAFTLGKEEYGIPILDVQEIKKIVDITRVPHTQFYIKGVINLRGSILPVIDLKSRLDLQETEVTEDTRIIIVKNNDVLVGIIVDAVSEVVSLSPKDIDPPPANDIASGVNNMFIQGVGKKDNRLVILLDLGAIIHK